MTNFYELRPLKLFHWVFWHFKHFPSQCNDAIKVVRAGTQKEFYNFLVVLFVDRHIKQNFTFDFFCCTFKSFSIFLADLYANAKVILNLKRIVRNNLNKNSFYKTSFWKFDNTLKIITSIFTRFYRTVDIFICTNNERNSFRCSIINTYVADDWDCVLLKLFILNLFWVFMSSNI